MDNVTTKAAVESKVEGLKVTFSVSGDEQTALSIQRMVFAHSPMLQQETGWSITVAEQTDGALMEIKANGQKELAQIVGLGFFGVMTATPPHDRNGQLTSLSTSRSKKGRGSE